MSISCDLYFVALCSLLISRVANSEHMHIGERVSAGRPTA